VQQRIQQVQEQGQQASLAEIRMVRVDGRMIDVESILVGIVYEGKPAVQILIADITDRKQAEADLQAQAQLLDLAHDTIMVRDLSDRIIFWNQGAVKMYGYTRAQALGQNVRTLLQSQFPQPIEDIEAELLRFGRWEGELVHTRADGSRLIVASRWALQRDEYGIPVKILEINCGSDGLAKAETQQPDAILLDVMMPGMDGPTTFHNLQTNTATQDIPVVFLTAKVQAAEQRRFAELGAKAVLTKPFDPLTLAIQVAKALGWSSL
jgi:PAS domain S-box-containing protein